MCVAIIHGYSKMPMREVRLESENIKEDADTARTQRGIRKVANWSEKRGRGKLVGGKGQEIQGAM